MWSLFLASPYLSNAQALVSIPWRRPKLAAQLRAEDLNRRAVPHLGAFNERLWAMTAAPLRYFRSVALWLFRTTAALQVGQGVSDACWQPR